jgi:hypothetical protein
LVLAAAVFLGVLTVNHEGSTSFSFSTSPSSNAATAVAGVPSPDIWATMLPSSKTGEGIAVSNKYIRSDATRPSEYPWLKNRLIVEPFKATTFSAVPLAGESDPQMSEYNWVVERPAKEQGAYELDLKASRRRLLTQKGMTLAEINEKEPEYDDDVVVKASGKTLVHTFDELGLHRITMGRSKDEKEGDSDSTAEAPVVEFVVRYVRRELHSVDDEDRENVSKKLKREEE